MLSSRSRYALRALSYLAEKAPAPQTTEQIASATGLPLATLAKILQALSHAGIVKTQRGVGGGVELARVPEQLSVKEVVDVMDTASSSDAFACAAHCPCLQRRLRVVNALADLVLKETTIAELVATEENGRDRPSTVDSILEDLTQMAGIEKRTDDEVTGPTPKKSCPPP